MKTEKKLKYFKPVCLYSFLILHYLYIPPVKIQKPSRDLYVYFAFHVIIFQTKPTFITIIYFIIYFYDHIKNYISVNGNKIFRWIVIHDDNWY